MPFCNRCCHPLVSDANFCSSCGSSLLSQTPPPASWPNVKRGSRLALQGFLLGFGIAVVALFIAKDEPTSDVVWIIGWALGAVYITFYLRAWKREQRIIRREGTAWVVIALLSYLSVCSLITYEIHTNRLLPPGFAPAFFLVCGVAYLWWGIGLVYKSHAFLRRVTSPWNRLPRWAVKGLGILLLVGGAWFLYKFAARISGVVR